MSTRGSCRVGRLLGERPRLAARHAHADQRERAADVIDETRRKLYAILAEE